jgi:CHASE3 domain sensor protein
MFVIVMVAGLLVVNAWLAHHNIRQIRSESILASRTRDVLIAIETIMSLAKDAETGQRGYLITGETSYLEPYNIALANIDKQVKTLEQLTADNPAQQARIPALKPDCG